jgi:hypothetical protein
MQTGKTYAKNLFEKGSAFLFGDAIYRQTFYTS